MAKTKRYTKKRKMKGGGKLSLYKLSPTGIASGGTDPFYLHDNIVANQTGGWRLKDVGGRLSAKKDGKGEKILRQNILEI